jgi:hypothetical protein
MARKTFAETLQEQRTLIFNSSKPEIAPKLDAMGITAEHLTIGEALHNDVTELNSNQDKEEQESRRAYDIFHEEMSECASDASINYRIIKMASRSDKDLQNRLKLYEPKEYKIEAWIKQTVNFYNRVLNEETLLSSINKYGVTAERLKQEATRLPYLQSTLASPHEPSYPICSTKGLPKSFQMPTQLAQRACLANAHKIKALRS